MKKSKKIVSQPQFNVAANKTSGFSGIDFKIILIVIAYLLIDFLPYFKSIEIIHPQFLYLSIVNLAVIGFVYYNRNYFDVALFSILRKSYVFLAYVAFTALCFLSIFVAKNLSLGILSIVQMLVVFTIFINLAILLYNRFHLLYNIIFLVGLSAFFQTLQALFGLKEVAETKSLVEALSSTYLKGNTGNINIFAASLLIKVPFVLVGIAHFTNWKRWFLAITFALMSMAVFLVSARASLISLFVLFIGFVVFYLKTNGLNKKNALRACLVFVLPMIVAFSASNLILKKTNTDSRYVSTTERLKQIQVSSNDGSINLRYLFWKNAINFTKEKPILGIGLGNWRIESIPFEPKGGLDLSLHTHNDFLEIFAETGVLNGLVYLSLFFAVLLINVKMLLKADNQQTKLFAFLALMLLVVYGIDSLFNFPMYRPTMKIGFCILLVLTIFNQNEIKKPIIDNKVKISFWFVLIAVFPLYFTYHAFKTAQLENSILLDNSNIEKNQPTTLSGDSIVKHHPKYPDVFSSSESFVEHAAVYYIYEKKYELAKKYLDSADKINPYLATPDFLRYYITLTNGKVDSAYSFIKSCFYKRPSVARNFMKAVEAASFKKDTLELYKMYRAVSQVSKTNTNWDIVYKGLQVAGVNNDGLDKFLRQGLIDFANDSLIMSKRNLVQISKHLVEGQRLFVTGKHEKALQEYQKGLKIDPTNVFVMQNIAFYYYNLGKTEQAIAYFLKALSLPGLTGGQTEFYLAQCYLKINNKDKACQFLKIAKDSGFAGAAEAVNTVCK